MTTQPKYDFRSLAITNIGCDEARKIMDFFLHLTESKINVNISLQKNIMLLADLIYREPLPMVNYINGRGSEELFCKETGRRKALIGSSGATGTIWALRGYGCRALPFSSPL